jgi:hypothetical protein
MGIAVHLIKEHLIISKNSSAAEKRRHRRDVVEATGFSENLSEEVRKGLRTKAAEGLWRSYAPHGYRNTVRGDGKHVIEPDPVFGPIVTEVLELFSAGEYSIQRLAARAFELGFRFRKSNGRIPVSTLQRTLRNPIYMGEFDYGGIRYQGIHGASDIARGMGGNPGDFGRPQPEEKSEGDP